MLLLVSSKCGGRKEREKHWLSCEGELMCVSVSTCALARIVHVLWSFVCMCVCFECVPVCMCVCVDIRAHERQTDGQSDRERQRLGQTQIYGHQQFGFLLMFWGVFVCLFFVVFFFFLGGGVA